MRLAHAIGYCSRMQIRRTLIMSSCVPGTSSDVRSVASPGDGTEQSRYSRDLA
jgi:hypothetical protein